jgi:Fe-S cluster biogenesis protein NfuA
VKLSEIDGPIVKLELVGACGTCPSSSMTMKMGLERKLKERIPEILDVIQSLPNAPSISTEEVRRLYFNGVVLLQSLSSAFALLL